jgi:type IV pilus assembly protein PilC
MQDFLVFNQELTALLKAGVPILRALDLLADRAGHAGFQEALVQVRDRVKGGASLSEAMAHTPRYFPELYVASLRSGEHTGRIVEVLTRYIVFLRRMNAVRTKVRSAMAYPSFLILVGLCVIIFLVLFVLPAIVQVYRDAQAELPALTRGFLAVIELVRGYALWLVIGAIAAVAAARFVLSGPRFQAWMHQWIFYVPVIGRSVWMHHVIGMTRTLAATLQGGIPLVPALRMVQASMTNRLFADGVARVADEVTAGGGLSGAMARAELLPRMSIEMIEIGEQAGALPEMLGEVAEFHEGELDRLLNQLMTWIEPILLLVMGSIVALILVSMYLPIFYLPGVMQ